MLDKSEKRRIDWTAVLALAILALAILTMVAPMVFGVELFGVAGRAGLEKLLSSFARSPWAPLEIAAAIALLSLTGFPIFVLIGGAAAIFGSLEGFLYSWIGTVIGASAGFWIGRVSGGALIRRYGGRTVRRASLLLGRRGILASALVRIIPSGPAIMVNMIAGASHMRFWQFLAGTVIGTLPKTAVIAFVGDRFVAFARQGDLGAFVVAGLALLAWFLLGWWVRQRFLAGRAPAPAETREPLPPGPGDPSVH